MTSFQRHAVQPATASSDAIPATVCPSITTNRHGKRTLRLHSEHLAQNTLSADRLESLQQQVDALLNPPSKAPDKQTGNKQPTKRAKSLRKDVSTPREIRRKVQVRLTERLIRILQKFAAAGTSAGHMIEKTMWRDEQIQDAALILGIDPPERRPKGRIDRSVS